MWIITCKPLGEEANEQYVCADLDTLIKFVKEREVKIFNVRWVEAV